MIKWLTYLSVCMVGAVLFNTILVCELGVNSVGNIRQSLWCAGLFFTASFFSELSAGIRRWGKK